MPRRGRTRPETTEPGASGMRAAGRIFVPGMGLLIAALGLILVASLARSEAGPQPRPAAATPAAVPP